MRTITGKEAAGRGRDLEILTVDVVAAGGRTTSSTVVCPKEQRTRPVDECVPCTDGTGPVNDPAAQPGYFGCDAHEGSVAGATSGSATDVDRAVTTIMKRSVVAFRADVPVTAARAELLGRALPGAPVVDRDGHPVGVLTYTELLRGEVSPAASALVGDVMLRRAFAVADTAPIAEVAAVMAAEGVTVVPVVAREGRVVGVVTALDVVEWLAAKEDRGARRLP